MQLCFSLVYAYYWYKLKIWYKPERESRKGDNSNEIEESVIEEPAIVEEEEATGLSKLKNKLTDFFSTIWVMFTGKFETLFDKLGIEIGESYMSGEFWRIAIFVLCSFIGTFFYPILFFIHLIDIFCKI